MAAPGRLPNFENKSFLKMHLKHVATKSLSEDARGIALSTMLAFS